MAVERVARTICDGCGKVIEQDHLYSVYLADNNQGTYQFHDYTCVGKWAASNQQQLNKDVELALAHKELHAALKKKGVDPYDYAAGIDSLEGNSIEAFDLAQTKKRIAEIQRG